MPPKKSRAEHDGEENNSDLPSRGKTEQSTQEVEEEAEVDNNDAAEEPAPYDENDGDGDSDPDTGAHAGQKRKEPPTNASKDQTKKSQRRNSDSSPATPKQLLNFLLSAKSLPYCFPEEELEAAKSSPKYKSYSLSSPTSFTPFEHLLCAHLLSKPLSHVLGMRSIRTLLNDPFNFSTPESIVEAGEHRVWEALEAARTQHRQKTATYIYKTGQAYSDSETMYNLAVEANEDGPKGVVEHIKSTVAGLGAVGGEIFCRRIQCVDGWGDALWPFADGKSLEALREIGINVKDADDLQSAIEREVNWDLVGDIGLNERDLSKQELSGEEEETQIQAEFVVVLERAVGCMLEGKISELRKAAAEL